MREWRRQTSQTSHVFETLFETTPSLRSKSAAPSTLSGTSRIKVIRPPASGPSKITVGSNAAGASDKEAVLAPRDPPQQQQQQQKPRGRSPARSPVRKQSADSQLRKSSLGGSPAHRPSSFDEEGGHRQRRRSSDYTPQGEEKEKKRKKRPKEPEPEPKDKRVVDTERLRANVKKTLCEVLYCR